MGKSELSRREVLSGLAVAGGTGAFVSGGTLALFSDEEVFANNSVTVGIVDLEVDWALDSGESGSSEGDVTIPIEITEENRAGEITMTVSVDDDSNPVYAWLGSLCPDPAADFINDLQVTLSYKDGETIADGTLLEVTDGLQDGEALTPEGRVTDPENRECLQSSDPIELVFEWSLPEYKGDDDTSVTFRFYGRQCRHTDGTANPFSQNPPECEAPDEPRVKSISYIAFCTDGEVTDPSEDITDYIDAITTVNDDGEPIEVEWSTDYPVDYVVVRAGDYMWIYDYADVEKTAGTAGTIADQDGVIKYDDEPGEASSPCEVAARETGGSFDGTQIKIQEGGDK
ncbi:MULTISPECIES: SipW-dependent-type signal peptide-containing protein [Salinibaculum]|uniref:SipW-dependent-type signal peptide-containing protein n=1 Tax=Salinibaculum TaxID=2732368 RepID=UPI0030CBDB06